MSRAGARMGTPSSPPWHTPPMRRLPASLAIIAGLALVVGVPAGLSGPDESTLGDAPAAATSAAGAGAPSSGDALADDRPAGATADRPGDAVAGQHPGLAAEPSPARAIEVTTRSARLSDLPPVDRRATPVRVGVEALGIDAPVDRVGVEDDGALEIPDDARRAGWYRHGAAPGQSEGSAVLAAHVDSRTQGRGAFYALREAQLGDEVVVEGADGEESRYAVTARASYGKAELPIAELFRREGPHQLVLVTCGGAFDPATGSYEENVVVVAEPTDG